MSRIKAGPGQRLAIRHGDVLLSVPPMNPNTPPGVRVKVFEYVLRRQIGLAQMTAQFADEADESREAFLGAAAALLSEAPHASGKRSVA